MKINKSMKKNLTLLSIVMFSLSTAFAQEVEMADTMRSEGKIYVVVAVAFLSLAILSFYMIRIERKVTKLEKEMKK